ncbi:MAG: geranylgeranyl reductase family protein [Silvibacterium sp.]|nr:geranylgeranyl reductase family protein [Silvibacterium sp.]
MKTWDAIIVGAGPAGCAAAYDLASAGHEVLLLDKADFPRQKACAGGLTVRGLKALRYSVEPVVRQKIARMRLERDADRATTMGRRTACCFMTVRQELDEFCFRKTLARGPQFRRIRAIDAIEQDSSGVNVSFDGEMLRGRFLVGADGVHSRVRQLTGMGEGWFWRAFALEGTLPMAKAATQDLVFDFAPVRDGYGWIFPKGDHLNVGLYSYAVDERIDRARLAGYISARFGAQADSMIGQYAGFGAAQHQPGEDRVFLTGDAGGFADPLTGEGIYFAIASGQAAAAAIEQGLTSGVPAYREFAQETAPIRADLALRTSAARWFYRSLDAAFRLLSMPLTHGPALSAFVDGSDLRKFAALARK